MEIGIKSLGVCVMSGNFHHRMSKTENGVCNATDEDVDAESVA